MNKRPELDLAFMTGGPTHTSYSGDFIKRCMQTLESVRGRPGHGYYVDAAPRDILRKAMDVAWQIADYPDFTVDIQYEYEDFPSIPLDKARTIISAENALAVASGCNGIAVHTFQLVPNSFEEYGPMMESLQADYSYLEQMTRATASTPQPAGLWIPWTSNFMARRMVDGKWFRESSGPLTAPLSWCAFGIPVSAEQNGSSGTILAGDAVDAFTDEELKDLLSGAVFMDGQALEALADRGLDHLAGVSPGEKYLLASERLTDHEVNGRHSGEWRKVYFGATGMNPEIGRKAAEEQREEIKEILKDSDMVFVTCGLGGGTGSGAAPVVAGIAKNLGALTVAVVTKPFSFEGITRERIAQSSLRKLKERADALISISNDKLLSILDPKTPLLNAFWICDDILRQAVQGISDLIILPGIINVDFADVKTILKNSGTALFGIGRGRGEKRAEEAVIAAINSPLLEISCKGAKGILFNVSGGKDITLSEIDEVAKFITQEINPEARVIFGAVQDEKLKKGEIKVTVIATGF